MPEVIDISDRRLRILLVGNYAPLRQESMQRFAEALYRELEAKGIEVRLLRPPVIFGRARALFKRLEKWLGYVDSMLIFPLILRHASKWADVVHICDHSNAPYVAALKRKIHLLTCHDMLAIRSGLGEFPDNVTGWTGRLLQRRILHWLERAQCVICDSEATRQDFLRLARRSESSASVIYVGFNRAFQPLSAEETRLRLSQHQLEQVPFLLHVGGNQWYKNRWGVLRIFAEISSHRPDLFLVMAGKPLPQQLLDYISATEGLRDKIRFIESPDDAMVDALYSGAEGLLFPSLYEGFGWPIVEAQACGCPVFTSNRAPMNEIGGNAAVYVDPDDFAGAAAKVLEGLENRQSMSIGGMQNANRFSTQRMIDQYVDLYWRLLGLSQERGGEAEAG